MGTGTFNSGDGERGPSWYDVNTHLRECQLQSGGRVRFVLEPVAAVNGKWGLRATVRLVGAVEPIAVQGYGPAYPNGSKTMAGACFTALLRAREYLDAAGIDARRADIF